MATTVPPRSREAAARRAARLLRRRRPRRADRRARARALRRAGLRAQGDRPQQARRRAAARARRDLRRGARRHEVPEGATVVFSAHGVSPAVHADAEQRGLQTIDATCPLVTKVHVEAEEVRRRGLHDRARSATPATRRSRARWARRPSTSCSSRPRPTSTRSRSRIPSRVAYISQTTLSVDETRAIIARLREQLPAHRRAAHRRHLLRHDQPPGGRQADGRASATSCS